MNCPSREIALSIGRRLKSGVRPSKGRRVAHFNCDFGFGELGRIMPKGGVYIGLGANLPSPEHGTPRETLAAALRALEARGLAIVARAPLYESEPVPVSDQPWYLNTAVEVATDLGAPEVLAVLHSVENAFGRVRGLRNAARVLDLDLLDHRGEVRKGPESPVLPHPRLADRAFVLRPLCDIAPDWRHPASGLTIAELLESLPEGQRIRRLEP
jgi:2-amino-4-hydroxy-6-hydroxymethyldihydropteridine diphosphokinase